MSTLMIFSDTVWEFWWNKKIQERKIEFPSTSKKTVGQDFHRRNQGISYRELEYRED